MKKLTTLAAVLAVVLVGAAPALAQVEQSPEAPQVAQALVNCVTGEACFGTSGNDTLVGTDGQDVISALEGDDLIVPGRDLPQDFVFCGPGFDVVTDQSPVLTVTRDQQGFLQYAPDPNFVPDFVAEDCEVRAP